MKKLRDAETCDKDTPMLGDIEENWKMVSWPTVVVRSQSKSLRSISSGLANHPPKTAARVKEGNKGRPHTSCPTNSFAWHACWITWGGSVHAVLPHPPLPIFRSPLRGRRWVWARLCVADVGHVPCVESAQQAPTQEHRQDAGLKVN